MSEEMEASACPNCGRALAGPYCSQCGQKAHLHHRLRDVLGEMAEAVSHFDGRLFRTLPLLLFRPGVLSADWKAGRRARYVAPTHIFLFCVFLLFLVPQFTGRHMIDLRSMLHVTVTNGTGPEKPQTLRAPAVARMLVPAVVRGLSRADYYNYKVESLASKLALLMAPILTGIFTLLLFFRRTHSPYDHAVAALYELSWLSLALTVANALPGSAGRAVLTAVALLLPVHMIAHLKIFYRLGFAGATAIGLAATALCIVAAWILIIAIILLGLSS